jgi:hypothetical protein
LDHALELLSLLGRDHGRSRILGLVQSLDLPDCWIGAGFVRNAVWDHLHGMPPAQSNRDVDVIWFDPHRARPADDDALEARLRRLDPNVPWSVRNQCRMHLRNHDTPYISATDALRFWPETATAVAVRRARHDGLEIAAPFGLDDLFGLIVRPTPRFSEAGRGVYLDRVRNKQWLRIWPRLTLADQCDGDWFRAM